MNCKKLNLIARYQVEEERYLAWMNKLAKLDHVYEEVFNQYISAKGVMSCGGIYKRDRG